MVAHAFFPEFGGDAHFDNGEDWTVNKYKVSFMMMVFSVHASNVWLPYRQGVSLLQSVTHELGHSLGLLHSNNYRAMMSPYHKVMVRSVLQINITVTSNLPYMQGWKPNLSLDSDDVRAVKALYGGQTAGSSKAASSYKRPRNYYYRYRK